MLMNRIEGQDGRGEAAEQGARLMRGDRFEVRHRRIAPGERLSLRGHFHRAEHWIAVAGAGSITMNGRTMPLHEASGAFVPAGTLYAIENTGRVDLHLIEVRLGGYLEDDDRFAELPGNATTPAQGTAATA